MKPAALNLFADLPANLAAEAVLPLIQGANVRIERIVSAGHTSPEGFWYDQAEHEWVVVLQGWGIIEYPSGTAVELRPGDSLHLPPQVRHRVKATSDREPTIWLAVFWRE